MSSHRLNQTTQNNQWTSFVCENFSKILYSLKQPVWLKNDINCCAGMINQKGVYGMVSGVITTGTLQPFENIKMALMIPPKQLRLRSNFASNFILASKYIQLNDGWKGFYKGLSAATIKAALGCYIYFSGLRYFEVENQSAGKNFTISSIARIVSTFLTNPLNIIETRFELADFHGYNSIMGAAKDIYAKEGISAFFSGGLTSCIKEGAFGGFYYMIYEELKDAGLNRTSSGILAGMLSTAITHPFQIIRAKLQTIGLTEKHKFSQHMIMSELKSLKSSGEWMKGLAPRLVKKPIANTLTFLIFQVIEDFKEQGKTH